jgi:hypothetical protein
MARPSVHGQMATVIGGSGRITRGKDMEQTSGLMEGDTRGNSRRVSNTGMEYTHCQVDTCIKENGNRTIVMVMVVTYFHQGINTMVSSKIVRYVERESRKRETNYLLSSMRIISL